MCLYIPMLLSIIMLTRGKLSNSSVKDFLKNFTKNLMASITRRFMLLQILFSKYRAITSGLVIALMNLIYLIMPSIKGSSVRGCKLD